MSPKGEEEREEQEEEAAIDEERGKKDEGKWILEAEREDGWSVCLENQRKRKRYEVMRCTTR